MNVMYIAAYLAVVNVVGFVQMAWDKFQAKRGGWRVPEKTLLGTAAIGGGIGVYAGMRMFRHKTLHTKFSVGVPAIMIVQAAAAAYLLFSSKGASSL